MWLLPEVRAGLIVALTCGDKNSCNKSEVGASEGDALT